MSDRLKYSLNGVYRCENFAELARQNNFPSPRVPIGSVGGIDGWFIVLEAEEEDDGTSIYPLIGCNEKPAVALHVFCKFVKTDGSSSLSIRGPVRFVGSDYGVYGDYKEVAELLNEENEYLDDDGALTVEYGIHVYAILRDDGIWKFNLKDYFFEYEKDEKHMITCTEVRTNDELIFYVHPQFITFESSPSLDFYERQHGIEFCLQIAHGVRFHLESLPTYDWDIIFHKTVKVAQSLKLTNVVAYCERELIKQDICEPAIWIFFRESIEFNLRRILAFFLREISNKYVLKDTLNEMGTDRLTGEIMKMLAAKIFELGAENY